MIGLADLLTNLADLFEYNEYPNDLSEKEYALAILMILEDFTKKYNSKSYSYIEKHFDDDCKRLEEKLLQVNEKQFEKYENATRKNQLLAQDVPTNKHKLVNLQYDLKTTKQVMETTIKNIITSLRNEVKLNIQVVKDMGDEDSFNLEPKLREAIKRVKNTVKYGTGMGFQKIRRSVYDFKYGKDATYKWVTRGDSQVCAWCRAEERKPPRPLDELPFDHMNGRCGIEPVSARATAEYNKIVYGDVNGRDD